MVQMRARHLIPCVCLLVSPWLTHAAIDAQTAGLPSQQLVTKADTLLASGSGTAALELYDVVLERDPEDYLSRYKRATARSALGHLRKALDDYEGVLKLTEFSQARLQMARLLLKLGQYAEASEALKLYLKSEKADASTLALKQSIKDAEAHWKAATKAAKAQKWDDCVKSATVAIDLSPNSFDLRELRANCHLSAGHIDQGVGELNRAITLSPSSASLLLRLSLLSYFYLGQNSAEALTGIKQCLHFDPESKPCKTAFRQLKSLDKDVSRARNFMEAGRWRQAADILDRDGLITQTRELVASFGADINLGSIKVPATLLTTLIGWACRATVRGNSLRSAATYCNEALALDPNNVDAFIYKGEDALQRSEFEEAVRYFSEAFEKGGRSDRETLERVQKAQKLLKQSKSKDYYKILGVARDADDKTIKRAYRKATLKAHPDKEGGSEQAMAALNEAYEVLSKPELRARFDAGDDPNDPASQHQAHGNPFAFHGQQAFFHAAGNPFHGGFPFPGGQQGRAGGQTFHFQWG